MWVQKYTQMAQMFFLGMEVTKKVEVFECKHSSFTLQLVVKSPDEFGPLDPLQSKQAPLRFVKCRYQTGGVPENAKLFPKIATPFTIPTR